MEKYFREYYVDFYNLKNGLHNKPDIYPQRQFDDAETALFCVHYFNDKRTERERSTGFYVSRNLWAENEFDNIGFIGQTKVIIN